MVKLSKQDAMFKKHLTVTFVIAAIIIPVISYFILPAIRLLTPSNDVYRWLGVFLSALNTVDLFLVYGILITALVRFGMNNSSKIIGLGLLRYAIIYLSNVLLTVVVVPLVIKNYEVDTVYNLLVFGINIIVDVLPYAGAIIMTSFLCSKYIDEKKTDITIRKVFDRKNPLLVITLWVTVLISATLLSEIIVGTATSLSSYLSSGYQITSSLISVLVEPYFQWILKTVIGYFIMLGVGKWFEFQWQASREIKNEPKNEK